MLTRLSLNLWTLLAAAIFIASIVFKIANLESPSKHVEMNPMRWGTVFHQGSKYLDPARIDFLDQYELVMNLYRPLVEYDNENRLTSAVASKYDWDEKSLIFHFSQDRVRTIDGHSITAQDAEISLKRAILFKSTGHGDIRRFLCPGYNLKSVSDPCPGISRDGDSKLILTPVLPSMKPHLLKALESADYSIIPSSSLDLADPNLRIKSHRNTSGPYYVDYDSPIGEWLLRANKNHYLFNEGMPEVIQLVKVDLDNIAEDLKHNRIDFASAGGLAADPDTGFLFHDEQFVHHESLPFNIRMIVFSPKAISDFSESERFEAAKIVQQYMNQKSLTGSKPSPQFFQALSEGTLSADQLTLINDLRSKNHSIKPKRPFTIGAPKDKIQGLKDFFDKYSLFQVIELSDYAVALDIELRPDIYIVSTDSAWTESISLLGYAFKSGYFKLPSLNSDAWLDSFLKLEDKKHRIQMLNQLHFDLLEKAIIYPVSVKPYYSFARKPWRLHFSSFSTGGELWLIRHKP